MQFLGHVITYSTWGHERFRVFKLQTPRTGDPTGYVQLLTYMREALLGPLDLQPSWGSCDAQEALGLIDCLSCKVSSTEYTVHTTPLCRTALAGLSISCSSSDWLPPSSPPPRALLAPTIGPSCTSEDRIRSGPRLVSQCFQGIQVDFPGPPLAYSPSLFLGGLFGLLVRKVVVLWLAHIIFYTLVVASAHSGQWQCWYTGQLPSLPVKGFDICRKRRVLPPWYKGHVRV